MIQVLFKFTLAKQKLNIFFAPDEGSSMIGAVNPLK